MTEALFAEFEAATQEDWLEAARASLRGRPLESLVSSTYEDIDIEPLVGADAVDGAHLDSLPGEFPFRRGRTGSGYRERSWLIAQDIDIADPDDFNAALREALANGQTAITLTGDLKLEEASDLRRALADIDLGRYPLFLADAARAPEIYRLLSDALSEDELSGLSGCIGYDPLASLARTGRMPQDAIEGLAAHVARVAESSPEMGSIQVSAVPYHAAGANAVQELALVLATAVAYLRGLSEYGLAPDFAATKLQVVLCIGENFFMEAAKFRAVKLLWAQMTRAIGVGDEGQRIRLHARSGGRNKTRRDRYVNLLRLTAEGLAAVIGGVDSLTIAPFDAPLGKSDGFSRRLSRNLQLILREEVELTQVIDPAGGAWHIERLTDELARRAWGQFQSIEAAGGMITALEAGMIQAKIAAIAERRRADVASGAAILVGVNKYVNADEPAPPNRSESAEASEEESGVIQIRVEPLPPLRLEDAIDAPPASGADA